MQPPRVAILSYHKVGKPYPGGWESWYYVPVATFRSHLALLQSQGWTFLTLLQFLDGIRSPQLLPPRAALITFDDAYQSLLTQALPVLTEFAAPSVVFTPTAYIGAANDFDDGAEPYEPIAGWDALRALQAGGMEVESHTVHHRALSTIAAPQEILTEFQESKTVLEHTLQKPVRTLAFPYGDAGLDHDQTHRLLKQTGYDAAFLYGGGVLSVTPPLPLFFPRLAMGPDTNLDRELHHH